MLRPAAVNSEAIVLIMLFSYIFVIYPLVYFGFYRPKRKGQLMEGAEKRKYRFWFSLVPTVILAITWGILAAIQFDRLWVLPVMFIVPLLGAVAMFIWSDRIQEYIAKNIRKKPRRF